MSHTIATIGFTAVLATAVGYLLGSRGGDDAMTPRSVDSTGRSGSPVLESGAVRDLRLVSLENALRERDAQIVELLERLARVERRESVEPGNELPVEAAKRRTREHLLTDPALAPLELAQRARAATSYTGQFHQYVVALHEKDVSTYLDAVWAARSEVARREGVELSPEEDLALRDVFRASWMELRTWARAEYMRAVESANSPGDLQALDAEWATKVSAIYNGLNQRARRALISQERFDQVSRFL